MPMGFALMLAAAVLGQGEASTRVVDSRGGAYCLFVSLRALDLIQDDYATFEKKLGPPGPEGYAMEQLAKEARSRGAHAQAIELDMDDLTRIERPFACVTTMKLHRFVCIIDVNDSEVKVVDPPSALVVPRDAFDKMWSGPVLLIADRELVIHGGPWWYYAFLTSVTFFILILTVVGARYALRQSRSLETRRCAAAWLRTLECGFRRVTPG